MGTWATGTEHCQTFSMATPKARGVWVSLKLWVPGLHLEPVTTRLDCGHTQPAWAVPVPRGGRVGGEGRVPGSHPHRMPYHCVTVTTTAAGPPSSSRLTALVPRGLGGPLGGPTQHRPVLGNSA